jgi:hypothetical protein
MKINLKKYTTFSLFLEAYKFNVCYGSFLKIAPPSRFPKPTQFFLRRHRDLRIYIPDLEGALIVTVIPNRNYRDLIMAVAMKITVF